AALDVRDVFLMVPLQEQDWDCFAFTWQGQQFTFTRVPQGYERPPALAHHAQAQELEQVPVPTGVKVYQHVDDILIGGHEASIVKEVMDQIISHLEKCGLRIPEGKRQGPSLEVKFLGIWWKGGTVCIPPDTLSNPDQIKTPDNRKELQHALGLLVFWRKHTPDSHAMIARLLHDLLGKGARWDCTSPHDEALQLLPYEAATHEALGPIHPADP
ncbi:hypothetical protein N330_08820, partial [Leptosomus discolor]